MAERHVIAECYAEWEITGPAEIRTPIEGWFNPFRGPTMHAAHLPINEEPLVEQSSIDDEPRSLPRAAVPSPIHHMVRATSTLRADGRRRAIARGQWLRY